MTNSTESPASATVSVTDINGFNWLLTFRDEDPAKLLPRTVKFGELLKSSGFKPQVKSFAPKTPFVPKPSASGNMCPKCGAPMSLSKLGKEYCSKLCWNNPTPVKIQEDGGPLPF